MSYILWKSTIYGTIAFLIILVTYFSIVSIVSGWEFAYDQFVLYGTYIVVLALGFGIQVGMLSLLRLKVREHSTHMIAATGTTSIVSVISCCLHSVATILPFLGISALVTLVAQYQIEIFWVGIASNILGIAYIASHIIKLKKHL